MLVVGQSVGMMQAVVLHCPPAWPWGGQGCPGVGFDDPCSSLPTRVILFYHPVVLWWGQSEDPAPAPAGQLQPLEDFILLGARAYKEGHSENELHGSEV